MGTIPFLLASQIGESDCEALSGGALVQPANALSSLSYVAAGLTVLVVALRHRRWVPASVAYAVALISTGLGSVAFHGPQPTGAGPMHDVPIVWTLAVIAVVDVRALLSDPPPLVPMLLTTIAILTPLSIVSLPAGAGIAGLAAIASEFRIYRRRVRPSSIRFQRQMLAAIIGAFTLSAAAWTLGRTGGPLCDPQGILQLHALWHGGSAIGFALWWWLASEPAAAGPAEVRT